MKRFVFLVVAIATLSTVATVWSANQSPMVMQKMDIMPLAFTQNNGQWADSILFRANAHGATIWFTDGGVYYQFTRRLPNGDELDKFTPTQATRRPNCDLNDVGVGVGSPDPNNLGPNVGAGGRPPVPDDRFNGRNDSLETMLIKASFVGANPNPQMRGDGLMEYKCNYFLGNDSTKWRTDVPNYQAIVFENIYAGIDLKYYGDGRKMEYDFVVSPGADPSQICMRYDGAKSLAVNDAGDLVVETDWGTVTELAPMVYQIENGERLPLRGSYQLESDDMFSFRLSDDYNPELAVVIDPVLTYSTYLGGGNSDEGIGIAIDGFGDVYAMGRTQSSNFPTQNPYDGSFNGFYDVFVTKFSAAGNTLVYSTYIGGDTLDEGRCIAIDGSGCAYVTGFTTSYNYPTLNAYDSSFHGGTYPPIDAFVTKLSAAGNSLVYSTFLGGVEYDYGDGIALDVSGCAYVTGYTASSDFPTQNPYDGSLSGPSDAFVTKLSTAGNNLIYSTYLGAASNDDGWKIGVDGSDCAYVTGTTQSSDFPMQNPYDGTLSGSSDVFVTKLSAAGNTLVYSTYLGGGSDEWSRGLAVDGSGYAYVSGTTYSSDFPTQNPYDGSLSGTYDAFVTKLSADGNSLAYSTYLGGGNNDFGMGIAVDGSGCAYMMGGTYSSDFPTQNPYDGDNNGGGDIFVAKFDLNMTLVSNFNDNGSGSLRDAIIYANANMGVDTIIFSVSGTTALASQLPALIDDSTVILGSTAPGGIWSVVLDGSGLSGGGDGFVIQSRDNMIEGLTIKNFPGNGISVTGALSIRNGLTCNLIYNNNGLGIDLGADGVTLNDPGDADTGPNDLLNYPEVDSVHMLPDSSFRIFGWAAGKAIIEFYVAHPVGDGAKPADPSGHGEAYGFAGTDTCDAIGNFIDTIPKSAGQFSMITATATDTLGNTSEFSQDFVLTPAPLIVVAYSPVNVIITDPDGLRFGKDSLGNDITGIPDGHYFITPNDSVVIDHPIEGTYLVQFVTEAGIPVGATYSTIIKIDGTQQLIIAADKLCPASGKVDTVIYLVEEGYHYKNGDANRDATLNVGDAVFVVNYIFKGGSAPDPLLAGDANCDQVVNIGDAVYVINYIFKGGPSPCQF